MFDWLRKNTIPDPGVVPDPRPQSEKDKDYEAKEVIPPAAPDFIDWRKKPKGAWRRYPIKDQDGSGSCVGQAVALALGVENELEEGKYLNLSPRSIYARRKNSGRGMWLQDGLHLAYKKGSSLEAILPSDDRNEEEMNTLDDEKSVDRLVARVVRAGGYIQSDSSDFDKVAVALKAGKAVAGIIRYEPGEFRNPEIKTTYRGRRGHCIIFTDYTLYDGKKALVFQNSWGDWGWGGLGVLKDNFKDGFSSWGFFQKLDNDWQEEDKEGLEKPDYEFNTPIKYHDNNDEVAKLQEVLKWEETFPKDVPCTGWYGRITAQAVYDFQAKHEVASMEELDSLQGMRVGPKTRAKLNELY